MAVTRSTVSFEPNIWAQLSKTKNRSRVVNNALNLYFSAEAFKADPRIEKRAAIKEALIQANEGVFISQNVMDKWVDSWDTDIDEVLPQADILPK